MKYPDFILAAFTVFLTWMALKWKNILFQKWKNQSSRFGGLNFSNLGKIEKIFTALIVFVGSLFGLQAIGLDIIPLVTFSGIGAAVLGFASKDFISNLYGGLMIYINRPFQVNDLIQMPSKNIEGTVEEIGWYLTTIRDKKKRSLYIPNSFFNTDMIINESQITHRRIEEVLRFRVQDVDRIQKTAEEIESILRAHIGIDQNQPIEVFISSLGPYGCSIEIKAYSKSQDEYIAKKTKEDILCKIYQRSTEPKFQ